MKYRFLSTAKDLVSMIANYILVVTVMTVLYEVTGQILTLPAILLMFLVPLILYVQRKNIDKLWLFFALHLCIPIAYSFAYGEKDVLFILDIIPILFFVISSFVSRLKKSEAGEAIASPVFAGAIFVLAILILSYFVSERNIRIVFAAIPIFAALYPISLYIERFLWFDYVSRKTVTNLPSNEIMKAGAPYVLGLCGFYLVSAYLCLDEELISKMSAAISGFIKKIIRFLLSFIKPGETENISETEDKIDSMVPDLSGLVEETEPSKFSLLMQKIFTYLAIVALVALVIVLIVSLIKFIISHFHGRDDRTENVLTNEYEEEREKVEIKKRKTGSVFSRLSTPEKIRRLYVKIARDNAELTDTPERFSVREFANLFSEDKREAAMGYALIYEKVRYSESVVTKDDYESAKNFASVLRKG